MAYLLYKEDSSYLQHQDNLVHWMPWYDETKSENKAIVIVDQAIPYIKEDPIIKAKKERHGEMEQASVDIDCPFTLRTLSSEDEMLLCGIQSCYASLNTNSDLNTEVNKTL